MGRWQFTPDTLNRLSSALNTAASSLSPQFASNIGCWSYDAFGNRTLEAMSTTPCANNPTPASWANYGTNNRFTTTSQAPGGAGYDAAGNVTYDGVNKYFYDTYGRICAVSQNIPVLGTTVMTGYLYDAEGRRIAKGTISIWGSCDPAVNGFQVMTEHDYILDLGGEQFTEMAMDANNSMGWQHTNVWAGGKLLATYDNDGLHFYFDDPLGTRRAQTDYAGVIEKTCASLPYGDGETCQPTPTEHLFTGKERDAESGNDYFGARYYSSTMGRFMSPDPEGVGAHEDFPQTWNMYSYSLNSPLVMTDPTGMYSCDDQSGGKCDDSSEGDKAVKDRLDQARDAARHLTGSDWADAMRGINAIGTANDGNGVHIAFGTTDGSPAQTTVQDKTITLRIDYRSLIGGDSVSMSSAIAHEGSHVQDAKDWANAGYTDAANPTRFSTEWTAYGVTNALTRAMIPNLESQTASNKNGSMVFWKSSASDKKNSEYRKRMIMKLYPNFAAKAWDPNKNGVGK